MMKSTNTLFILFAKALVLLLMIGILSCNGDMKSREQREQNMMDGDDRQQPMQDQDSINRVLNRNNGGSPDTLH